MGDMQVLKCAIVLRERRNRMGEAESVREREREVLNLSAAARFTCCSVIGNGWLVQEGNGRMGGLAEELGTLIFRLGVFHKQVIRTASSESCPTLEEA